MEVVSMDFPTSGTLMGACPMLAAPCRPHCPLHVDGVCAWFEPPKNPVELCAAADPRAWYLETLEALLD